MANFKILPLRRECRRRKCVCWPLSRRAWTEPTSRLRTPLRPCREVRWRFCKITQIIILHFWESQGRNLPAVFHRLLRVFHLEDSAVGRELRGGQVVLKKGTQNNYHGRCKSRLAGLKANRTEIRRLRGKSQADRSNTNPCSDRAHCLVVEITQLTQKTRIL
jgi:hypothetical protein